MGQGVAQKQVFKYSSFKKHEATPPEVQLSLLDLVNLLFLPFPVDETLKVNFLLDLCSLTIHIEDAFLTFSPTGPFCPGGPMSPGKPCK